MRLPFDNFREPSTTRLSYNCSVAFAIKFIVWKWTPIVIWLLLVQFEVRLDPSKRILGEIFPVRKHAHTSAHELWFWGANPSRNDAYLVSRAPMARAKKIWAIRLKNQQKCIFCVILTEIFHWCQNIIFYLKRFVFELWLFFFYFVDFWIYNCAPPSSGAHATVSVHSWPWRLPSRVPYQIVFSLRTRVFRSNAHDSLLWAQYWSGFFFFRFSFPPNSMHYTSPENDMKNKRLRKRVHLRKRVYNLRISVFYTHPHLCGRGGSEVGREGLTEIKKCAIFAICRENGMMCTFFGEC